MLVRGAGRARGAEGGLGAGSACGKMAPRACHSQRGTKCPLPSQVAANGAGGAGQSGTCVGGQASLADEQLRADGRAGMQAVQRLGDPQQPAGRVQPVQEAVNQEHHGRGRAAVPHQDGGLQISLERKPQAASGKLRELKMFSFLTPCLTPFSFLR